MVLSVYTSDGKEYNAGVVGFDSRTDIALLKLDDAKGLTPAQFGDSTQLAEGDDIVMKVGTTCGDAWVVAEFFGDGNVLLDKQLIHLKGQPGKEN